MKKIYLLALSGLLFFGTACRKEKNDSKIEKITVKHNVDAQIYRTELAKKKADLRQKLRSANREQADKLLIEYRKIFDNLLDSLNYAEANTLTNRDLWNDFDNRPDSIQQKIEQYDKLDLYFHPIDSTSLQLRFKPSFYYKTFQRKVSEDVKVFLLLQSSTQFDNYEQMDLPKSLALLRADLLKWEGFLNDYPESAYYSDAKKNYVQLIKIYWYGTENRPHISFSAKKMIPEFEQEMITLVKQNPSTITAKLSKKYADFFLDKGDSYTPEVLEKEVKSYNQNGLDKSFR